MKKMLKLALACAVLFTGISTYATDGNNDHILHIIKENGNVVTFGLENITKAKLTISDSDGTILYSENASGKDGILKRITFEDFPEGTYILKIEDNARITKHEITVTYNKVILSSKPISSVQKAGSSAKHTSVAVR